MGKAWAGSNRQSTIFIYSCLQTEQQSQTKIQHQFFRLELSDFQEPSGTRSREIPSDRIGAESNCANVYWNNQSTQLVMTLTPEPLQHYNSSCVN